MQSIKKSAGFSLLEVMVAIAVLSLFGLGIYSTLTLVFKIVYQSRMTILETATLSEQLETVRNLPYASIGIQNGIPAGVLPYSQTLTRDGASFVILTTVRNIDDPFDGVFPADTAPADYKLVEMSIQCARCSQQTPITLSTIVAPKNLEGASVNGALFINVFDSHGQPVQNANVHVVNSATNPPTVVDDVTDNLGNLHIVDAPTGTMSYSITVSKPNFSTDGTVVPSQQVPNPVKPPSNVVSQAVTNISFSIDYLAFATFLTMNQSCNMIGSVPLTMHGSKYIGTDPIVYKYTANFSTPANGSLDVNNLEWDTYFLQLATGVYSIAGTIPQLPFKLDPGVSQVVSVVLAPHTPNSLLVNVKDAGTGLPLSNATVTLTGSSYSNSILTGVGYIRQTDWSGGAGQALVGDDTKYFSNDGGVDDNSPAGDLKLRKTGKTYISSGVIESSTFDLGSTATLQNVLFEPVSQAPQTGAGSVLVQLATSATSTPNTWNFVGPDGTVNSFYTPTSTLVFAGQATNRYLRYRVFLNTADTNYTPQLSELSFTYTTLCTPPGQSFFDNLSSGQYTLMVERNGYASSTTQVNVSGDTQDTENLSTF